MHNTNKYHHSGLLLLIFFLILMSGTRIYGQCYVSVSPISATFTMVGDEITFSVYTECDYSLSDLSPFFNINRWDNGRKITINYFMDISPSDPKTHVLHLYKPGDPSNIYASVTLRIEPPVLTGGYIYCMVESVLPNTSPGTLYNAESPTGGIYYLYQWQRSTDNGNTWTDIPGAMNLDYTCPALTTTTSFRRSVTNALRTSYSNVLSIAVVSPLNGGGISCNTGSVAQGSSPGIIVNSSSPSGGTGSYSYRWQRSTNNGSTWTDIQGAWASSYSCPPLDVTTSFRRHVTSDWWHTAYSNTVTVTVIPLLQGGSIGSSTTTVEYGASPGTIGNSSSPSGGEGNFTYQWQQSTGDGPPAWEDIPGATGLSYSCPALITTTSFRRRVASGFQTAYSNTVRINVDLGTSPLNPSSGQNYILTRTMLDNAGVASFNRIDYYDGLGRGVESVMHNASPGQKDIVTLQEYDGVGRPHISYIPVPVGTSSGGYVTPSTLKTGSSNFYGDAGAYSRQAYEASPLDRVTDTYGPGSDWHTEGRRVATGYHANTLSGELSCALYAVSSNSSLQRKGLYAAGELYVTKTTGEDGQLSYTFTDKLGRVVLERVMDGAVMNDTYYVYDDFGNLRYVLPPAAAEALNTTATWMDDHTILLDYAYVYKYDGRNRCTRKVVPGCDSVIMRYDRADRLIFSQDGNQRSKPVKEWTFYLYDAFGRPAATGVWESATVPEVKATVVKATFNASAVRIPGYDVNLTFPSSIRLMTVNYYDDYRFVDMLSGQEKTKMAMVTLPGYGSAYPSNEAPNAKGLLTGSRTYRLDDPAKYSVSSLYYDHCGRVVQSHASNHVGGFEDEYFAYTFTGKVKQRRHVHTKGGQTVTETYTYNYGSPVTNPAERLLSVKHKLDEGAEVTLAEYAYDEIGRLRTKKVATETSTYGYNVRSWLTRIEGPNFEQTLTYNTSVNGVIPTKALYSGNISAMKWKSGDEATERGYKFTYDGLKRLTAANYGESANLTTNPDRFNEAVTAYDRMGNIQSLQRRGKLNSGYGEIDNLTYAYNGNRLTKVTDAVTTPITYEGAFHFVDGANVANEYTYDHNGNLTKDLNRKITSITYNSLNLPHVITFNDGKTITYGYDASGSKLSVTYISGANTVKTEYAGNKVYRNGTLSMLLTEEGYVTLLGSTPAYHYYLRDHQGNNRVVMAQNGTVLQVNHYYPFGGLFGEGMQTVNQPYRYNGKELDREFGLHLYDYGARHYDAALGVWPTPDPMLEKYFPISPYVYVANNPVKFIDPNGMEWKTKEDEEYARSLSQAMSDRKNAIWSDATKKYADYKNALGRGDNEMASKIETEMKEMGKDYSNMNNGISELQAMGDIKDQKFTYSKIGGNVGGAFIDSDGVITMEISGNGSFVNGIHESSHGFDIWKSGMPKNIDAFYSTEEKAYGRQFSFGGTSVMPTSDWGGIKSLNDITRGWITGIVFPNGEYMYGKQILGEKYNRVQMKALIKQYGNK